MSRFPRTPSWQSWRWTDVAALAVQQGVEQRPVRFGQLLGQVGEADKAQLVVVVRGQPRDLDPVQVEHAAVNLARAEILVFQHLDAKPRPDALEGLLARLPRRR